MGKVGNIARTNRRAIDDHENTFLIKNMEGKIYLDK
jgi:hypothetical protein